MNPAQTPTRPTALHRAATASRFVTTTSRAHVPATLRRVRTMSLVGKVALAAVTLFLVLPVMLFLVLPMTLAIVVTVARALLDALPVLAVCATVLVVARMVRGRRTS